jgi:hypothetical protein
MPDDPVNAEPDLEDAQAEREPLRELTLGQSRSTPAAPIVAAESGAPTGIGSWNLELIAAFCRAKSDAARWAAERQRRIRERSEFPDDDSLSDPALIEWAGKLTDAFYWANSSESAGPPDITLFDQVGGCFETVAEALVLASEQKDRTGSMERVLKLVAEAQSLLRQSLQRIGAPADPDQLEVYEWVRATAARHRIFLKRFMRGDDRTEPRTWPDLLARIEALAGSHPHSQRQRAIFDELRSHVGHIEQEGADGLDWAAVTRLVADLVGDGVPPSNREIRDLLLPIIDSMPETEDLPASFQLVLREIDRYLATRTPAATTAAPPRLTAHVQDAARLLSGRSLALIGGDRRPEAQEVLRTALQLKDVVWISTRTHQSIKGFESVIAQPDVALVLLAIRWSSHSFGDAKQFCDQYGKPLVRLPGGYSPNQVAAQILAQCSAQLSG